jgi:hypothetical protein
LTAGAALACQDSRARARLSRTRKAAATRVWGLGNEVVERVNISENALG